MIKSHTSLVQIHTGSPLQVYRDIPSDLAHVNSASFVGVTSIKRPDGSESAKEIHISPRNSAVPVKGVIYWIKTNQTQKVTAE
jgi:hypothetical protein